MATELNYIKEITNPPKFHEGLVEHATLGAIYKHTQIDGTAIQIFFNTDVTGPQTTATNNYVTNFVNQTNEDIENDNLKNEIFPFIEKILRQYRAKNLDLSINGSGKRTGVIGVWAKGYDIDSNGLPISLNDAFNDGALRIARRILQHLRDNPTEWNSSGPNLGPFINDNRLLKLKNKIETFLGLTLST